MLTSCLLGGQSLPAGRARSKDLALTLFPWRDMVDEGDIVVLLRVYSIHVCVRVHMSAEPTSLRRRVQF